MLRQFIGASALALAALAPSIAKAQDGGGIGGGPGPVGTSDLSGATLDDIAIAVEGAAGPESETLEQQALEVLGLSVGSALDTLSLERAIDFVRALPGVAKVDWQLHREIAPQRNRLAITITAGEVDATAPQAKSARFPALHRGDRSYLRVLINAGLGVLSDTNPWFRNAPTFTRNNPLVENPAIGADTGGNSTWIEMYVQYGLGGVAPIGESDVYLYGAATAVSVASVGEDIFRSDARSTTDIEKLYGGLLYAPKDGTQVNLGIGRQDFTLNEGFLITRWGSQYNAGPRPGIYLAPRTTHDMSALLTIKGKKLTSTSFYLDPNEFEPIESNTKLAGTNLRYNFTQSAAIDASYIRIVDSDASIATPNGPNRSRNGIQTFSVHGRWADADVVDGLWIDGEIAHQWHDDYTMDAWAGYGLIGYLARDIPWTPSVSYRFASFSGDDPDTADFERFDPLFTGGLGEWLQGITINKAINQANRQTHRIRTNVSPKPGLNFTFDLFFHRANELNNRGGNPALTNLVSRDLGMEYQFVVRWPISPRVFFVGVASHAVPGDAIRAVTIDNAKPWTSLQAQFYFNF
jgi:hypothetical protein